MAQAWNKKMALKTLRKRGFSNLQLFMEGRLNRIMTWDQTDTEFLRQQISNLGRDVFYSDHRMRKIVNKRKSKIPIDLQYSSAVRTTKEILDDVIRSIKSCNYLNEYIRKFPSNADWIRKHPELYIELTKHWTKNPRTKTKKTIYCIQNATTYASIEEAAKKLNLTYGQVKKVLYKQRKHTKGYSFVRPSL